MRFARRYRLHEAIGLHDLKVVVSHGNARSRLEPPELAVTRCHIPSHEGGVLIVLIKAELQLAHPPGNPKTERLDYRAPRPRSCTARPPKLGWPQEFPGRLPQSAAGLRRSPRFQPLPPGRLSRARSGMRPC